MKKARIEVDDSKIVSLAKTTTDLAEFKVGWLIPIFRVMRPHHWIKNLVVFGAAIFSGHLGRGSLYEATLAFFAFCMIASTIYIMNDIFDCNADREHPSKKSRPIASGQLPIEVAAVWAMLILGLGLIAALRVNPAFLYIITAYTMLQVFYNLFLKRQPILDILSIAMGFVLRALGGAYAVGVLASSWFILCVWLLALYLGIEKRKAEIKSLGEKTVTRHVLSFYSLPWLTRMESIVTSSILMSYSLWAVLEAKSQWMLISIPFVIYGLFKYQFLTESGAGEAPEKTLIKSPEMLINLFLWGVVCIVVILFGY